MRLRIKKELIALIIGLTLIAVSFYYIDYSLKIASSSTGYSGLIVSVVMLLISLVILILGFILIRDYIYITSAEDHR